MDVVFEDSTVEVATCSAPGCCCCRRAHRRPTLLLLLLLVLLLLSLSARRRWLLRLVWNDELSRRQGRRRLRRAHWWCLAVAQLTVLIRSPCEEASCARERERVRVAAAQRHQGILCGDPARELDGAQPRRRVGRITARAYPFGRCHGRGGARRRRRRRGSFLGSADANRAAKRWCGRRRRRLGLGWWRFQ